MIDERLDEIFHTTGHQCIHKGKAALRAVLLTAEEGNCTAIIYDGINANAEKILYLEALEHTTVAMQDAKGIKIKHGIYVNIGGTKPHISVVYQERHD